MSSRNIATVLLVVGLIILPGCGNIPQREVEKMIEAQLPTVCGPAADYQVHAYGHADSIMRGRVNELTVHGDSVQMSPYVLVDTLDIDAHDISVSPRTKDVESVGPIDFVATFGQDSVDRYMKMTADEVVYRPSNLKITLRQHDIGIHFLQPMLGQRIPITIMGCLQLHNVGDNKLDFVPSRASFSSLSLPKKPLRYVLSRINPIMDLTQTTVPMTILTVSSHDNLVTVTGTIDMTVEQMNKAIERARE